MGCVPVAVTDNPSAMAFDPSQIQLPPRGAKLRLPPKSMRKPTYAEVYQMVRRHLSEEAAPKMTTHVHGHQKVRHADSAGLRTID